VLSSSYELWYTSYAVVLQHCTLWFEAAFIYNHGLGSVLPKQQSSVHSRALEFCRILYPTKGATSVYFWFNRTSHLYSAGVALLMRNIIASGGRLFAWYDFTLQCALTYRQTSLGVVVDQGRRRGGGGDGAEALPETTNGSRCPGGDGHYGILSWTLISTFA